MYYYSSSIGYLALLLLGYIPLSYKARDYLPLSSLISIYPYNNSLIIFILIGSRYTYLSPIRNIFYPLGIIPP